MIGKTISHYRVTRQLGAGGMGVVYEAIDTNLDRTVALKFLPPELTGNAQAKARFVHEAKAASALDHPNVCAVFEIDETDDGQMFLAMACYQGETLKERIARGPLPLDEAMDIARQVAEGLAKAHARDIVHRDIKPANLFLTEDYVKILDFGLAKLEGQTKITRTGTTLGTASYMSPEQARGEETDARSDLWCLGVVLYEMVTGKVPFRGENAQAVINGIVTQEPEPVTGLRSGVPLELERIIGKCLAKELGERYHHAEDLLADLRALRRQVEEAPTVMMAATSGTATSSAGSRRPTGLSRSWPGRNGLIIAVAVVAVVLGSWSIWFMKNSGRTRRFAPPPHEVTSIAVLPFVDMSQDADQEYFADGLTEELLNLIARIPQLRVAGRSSSFQFKGETRDLRAIGEQLNVSTVLEGSVRKDDDEVRISVQLVDATDGYCRWSETYRGTLADIFATQEEIARAVAASLEMVLLDNEVPLIDDTDPNAYIDYLQGKYFIQRRNKENLEKAVASFQRAITADPDYAPAWAWLSLAYSIQAENNFEPAAERFELAREAANHALALDENLSMAHAAMGFIQASYDWDWASADRSLRRALTLEPNNAAVLVRAARLMWILGRTEEAGDLYRRSIEIDPLSPRAHYLRGDWAWYVGRLEEAEAAFRNVLDLDEDYRGARVLLARVLVKRGRMQEAKNLVLDEPSQPRRWIGLAIVNHALGETEEAEAALSRLLEYDVDCTYAWQIAEIYAFMDDADQAFAWLDRAYELRDVGITFLKGNPYLEKFRDDPRYVDQLNRLGLSH